MCPVSLKVEAFLENCENWPFYELFFYLIKKSNQNIYFRLEEMHQLERALDNMSKTSLS